MTTRLIQIQNDNVRRVGLVEEPNVRLLDSCSSIYELAHFAIAAGTKLSDVAQKRAGRELMPYDPIYRCESDWKLLPPIDHPEEPARCLISGTGLTHLGSARSRQSMHAAKEEELTDSLKMFRWGLEGGRPSPGTVGTPPEWFYKGTGFSLRAHGEPLHVPFFSDDGGEEAEVAVLYVVGPGGQPYRVGMAGGNEFSDHQFEKKNYLYLAGSKLRTCALGPELVLDATFNSVDVSARIERGGAEIWSKAFRSGNSEMCHSLENIEHHHFKYAGNRRAGDVHVHFLGTNCLSFSDNLRLQDGDIMHVAVEGFGRPLRNPVRIENRSETPVSTIPLG